MPIQIPKRKIGLLLVLVLACCDSNSTEPPASDAHMVVTGQVCTVVCDNGDCGSEGTLLIVPGKSSEFMNLMNSNDTAAKLSAYENDVSCEADAGIRVYVVDGGILGTSTVRVLTGVQTGCVGDIPNSFLHCHG
jgi:hypothetical protein